MNVSRVFCRLVCAREYSIYTMSRSSYDEFDTAPYIVHGQTGRGFIGRMADDERPFRMCIDATDLQAVVYANRDTVVIRRISGIEWW